MRTRGRRVLLLTPGDPDGVGPEVTGKALRSDLVRQLEQRGTFFVCIGDTTQVQKYVGRRGPKSIEWIDVATSSKNPGWVSGHSIVLSSQLLKVFSSKKIPAALVTGPISKKSLQGAGFPFPGHTEFLADLGEALFYKKSNPVMVLANPLIRVALATIHLAIKDIPSELTRSSLQKTLVTLQNELSSKYGVRKPKIAVLGLNPHAGEEGALGREEITLIEPSIRWVSKRLGSKASIAGPFSSDGFFATSSYTRFDVVLAMYHDQGLIPAKLLDFKNTVNITLGLPFIRTSVDHGTAQDIAGRGIADPSSMIAAIREASEILKHTS